MKEAEAQPSSEVLRLLGTVFLRGGRPLNAAIALKKAEAIAPLDEASRFTLAMAYVAMGKRAWARPELEKLAAQSPAKALYPYWLARLDYDDNQYATAVTKLEKAIALDPAFARAYDNLGLCYEALGRFDEAQRSYEAALRLNDEQKARSPWPSLNLGMLLTRLDRNDDAEARFRQSLRTDPGFGPAHYQLGVVLEKKGKTGEARNELEDAARLDPTSAETQYALARLYRRTGEADKADAALRRFEELKKQGPSPAGREPSRRCDGARRPPPVVPVSSASGSRRTEGRPHPRPPSRRRHREQQARRGSPPGRPRLGGPQERRPPSAAAGGGAPRSSDALVRWASAVGPAGSHVPLGLHAGPELHRGPWPPPAPWPNRLGRKGRT